MHLIVGLGNPGIKYRFSRHNFGFMVLERFCELAGIKLDRLTCQSLLGEGKWAQQPLVVAKPLTYMNLSGSAVQSLVNTYNSLPEKLLILHDDLDLPLGSLRVKNQGGSGGHKGVASIIQHVASEHFCRLRLGIGRPAPGEDVVAYVLQPFTPRELANLSEIIERAVAAIKVIIQQGAATAMDQFNRRSSYNSE